MVRYEKLIAIRSPLNTLSCVPAAGIAINTADRDCRGLLVHCPVRPIASDCVCVCVCLFVFVKIN